MIRLFFSIDVDDDGYVEVAEGRASFMCLSGGIPIGLLCVLCAT